MSARGSAPAGLLLGPAPGGFGGKNWGGKLPLAMATMHGSNVACFDNADPVPGRGNSALKRNDFFASSC